MRREQIRYYANITLTSGLAVAGALYAAELSDRVTDSSWIRSIVSTVTQWPITFAGYYLIETLNDRQRFLDRGRIRWREIFHDSKKLIVTLVPLGIPYALARSPLMYYFQEPQSFEALSSILSFKEGFSPIKSSLMADGVCCSVYIPLSAIIARHTGLMRNAQYPLEKKA